MRRWMAVGVVVLTVGMTTVQVGGPVGAQISIDGPITHVPSYEACTDPDQGLDVGCLPDWAVQSALLHVCDHLWLPGICDLARWPDPGYVTLDDPSPDAPLALRVGILHQHSGYSDGDPTARPRDYYEAAKTGHNQADAGGDTGVKVDFLFASEHSDNGQIPVTTAAVCLAGDPLACARVTETDHYWKWPASLRQAREATDDSFAAIRGFEWTNDYFNHMNVYFSRNIVNAKVDGSYLSMDVLWDWLRTPVDMGGGSDGLLTFNHPGGNPSLSPFDGDTPINELLAEFPGGANWNDLAYVPDVDERVAGMEVKGGDDIEWYTKALHNGWHIGPVAAEDEHEREWSSSADGKTLILTRGTSPQDYYYAFREHRTISVLDPLIGGEPGTKATYPTIHYWANADDIQDATHVLGSTITEPGVHTLHTEIDGLDPGDRVALVGPGGPFQLGAADGAGAFSATQPATTPADGEDWYFVVTCPAAGEAPCGSDQTYTAVTAPIWLAAS